MWDLRVAHPFGRVSIRNLLVWTVATLAASLAFIFISAPTTHAADATWSGSSINYNNQQYVGPATLPPGNTSGLPADVQVYSYAEQAAAGTPQKVHFIYFDAGVDTTKATSAKYVEYLFTPPGTYTQKANEKTISLDASTSGTKPSECAIKTVGWIVCGISNFLADGMDNIFEMLKPFVEVEPTAFTQKGDLYTAWNIMRGFANVMFIIGFLVIIYSQITNIGISNYGIKKTLPRLIVAAVLVNASYYICAIGIDISNILGSSIQDLFMNIRDNTFHLNDTVENTALNWKNLTAFILSAGTMGTIGAFVALGATGGTVLGAVYALIPLLVGLFFIVLVVLIILAARQALIVILVVIAPIAFVGRLLPGTEKWSKKWDDTFLTLLVFFPGFSLIFGGSQLAGAIIIQNSQTIIMILFGMGVQVAPLALVPFILKLSTGLLGRIAGMVNNPRKGLLDRTKNWAGERQQKHVQRGISGDLRGRNIMRRAARRGAMSKRNLQRDTEMYKQKFEEYATQKTATDKKRQKVELELELSKIRTKSWEDKTKQAIEEFRAGNSRAFMSLQSEAPNEGPLGNLTRRFRDSKDNIIDRANAAMNRPTRYDNVAMNALRDAAVAADQESRVVTSAIHAAQHQQQHHFAEALESSTALRQRAGGIDPVGAVKAEASAMSEIDKAANTVVDTGITLLSAQALRQNTTPKNLSKQRLDEAMSGISVDPIILEAALEYQARDGQVVNLERARMEPNIDQEMLSRVITRNANTLKGKGGFHLQANMDLALTTEATMNQNRMGSLADTSADKFKDLKAGWVEFMGANMPQVISDMNLADPTQRANAQRAYDNIYQALNDPVIRGTITERRKDILAMEKALAAQGFTPTPP